MKKDIVFISVIAILIIFILVGFIMLNSPKTYQDRKNIRFLSISNDGSYLLSVEGTKENNLELHVWDVNSGDIIFEENPFNYDADWIYSSIHGSSEETYLSPDGAFIIKKGATIYNISTTEQVADLLGYYKGCSLNNAFVVTGDNEIVYIYSTLDFNKTREIFFGDAISYASLSPESDKLAVVYGSENLFSLIDLSKGNLTYLWNSTTNDNVKINWGEEGNKIQIATSSDLKIFNVSDGKLLYEKTINVEQGPNRCNSLLTTNFEEYIVYSCEENKLFYYNLTNLTNSFDTKPLYNPVIYISYNGNVTALGYDEGIIEIRNSSTWELIKAFKTPLRELEVPTPGFELIFVLIAVVLVLFWQRRRS